MTSDVRTAVSLDVFPLPVPTVLAIQTEEGLEGFDYIPDDSFKRCLEIACSMGPSISKVGLVAERSKVEILSKVLRRFGLGVVLDPVFSVTKGGYGASQELVEAVSEMLIPISCVVTPNLDELHLLTGTRDPEEGAQVLLSKGAGAVIVKGGDAEGDPVDRLFLEDGTFSIEKGRVQGDFHGKGCSFSAALASLLARGFSVKDAFERASLIVHRGLLSPVELKDGWSCPRVTLDAERARVLHDLRLAVSILEENLPPYAIPEVGSNLCYALSCAKGVDEVAGFPSRIIKFKGRAVALSDPEFGASSHVARLVLTAMKWRGVLRSAMNIALRDEFLDGCKSAGLKVIFIDRKDEPCREKEGGSMEWVTDRAFSMDPYVDVVYDRGDVGKEPMIRVFGLDPMDVVSKVLKITGRGEVS